MKKLFIFKQLKYNRYPNFKLKSNGIDKLQLNRNNKTVVN